LDEVGAGEGLVFMAHAEVLLLIAVPQILQGVAQPESGAGGAEDFNAPVVDVVQLGEEFLVRIADLLLSRVLASVADAIDAPEELRFEDAPLGPIAPIADGQLQ
jgi:hypothetical protein